MGITEGIRIGPMPSSGSPMDDNCGVLLIDGMSGMLSISPAVA